MDPDGPRPRMAALSRITSRRQPTSAARTWAPSSPRSRRRGLSRRSAPPPEHGPDRIAWERRAGSVAAHRELTGHDDEDVALGAAPKSGQAEEYASWRAAWRALGRPEADREELELSDGQLRMRVRAYEREKTWAPRYVANELAATRQAVEKHCQTASLRTAEAENATGEDRARLQREAAEASALAETLDKQAVELDGVDQARARWLAHTAATRANADRAAAELGARRADAEMPEPEVTAEEWLAIQDQAVREEDLHREITETDVVDDELVPEPDRDLPTTTSDDVRDVAAREPIAVNEDEVRLPTAEESADSIEKAQRALCEIEEREAADAAREAEEARASELTRWHGDDQVVEHQAERASRTRTRSGSPRCWT